jgi:hypothetical protein
MGCLRICDRFEAICERIGSSRLYRYAVIALQVRAARQFPCSSDYPEDAATGIAATLADPRLDSPVVADYPARLAEDRATYRLDLPVRVDLPSRHADFPPGNPRVEPVCREITVSRDGKWDL